MAQFALRLDDGRPFTARGNLQIGWSGVAGEPAWCRWDRTLAVLSDNSLKAGIPLEHIQGQLEDVRGWSNGQALEVHGIVKLASVSLMGQQITELESPFHLERGLARLDSLHGKLLKGELLASGSISLDATPKYTVSLRLTGAQLEEYARTLAGPAVLPRCGERRDRPERPGKRHSQHPGHGRGAASCRETLASCLSH